MRTFKTVFVFSLAAWFLYHAILMFMRVDSF
jgi:hypothetical protein